ncbi:carboxypeptidase regulatory-like domain-containing protein [Acidicapsa dinghuensis]|uniref:Carboxypeptidase regulatory-like domain-containing protein n=1 Tax=Acidicapsa dinghuensis TaxID=2218256 RepID=A0ABW1EH81_9BACT|nr:TonB-dependent receptor [Acidicapsa dinghuensis]
MHSTRHIPSRRLPDLSRHRWLVLAALVILIQLLPINILAQTTADGTIHGQVTDASGTAVPNVKIVAHSSAVGGIFNAISDAEGNYRLIELPPGTDYIVDAELSGYDKFERTGLVVRAGLNITVDIQLKVGSAGQTVEVTEEAPIIDTQSAEQATNLSGALLRSIPITGRHDWSDSLQITPGIISASSDAEGGQTYFLRGSENENHATLLDGMDIGSFEQNWPSNTISIANESLGDIQIKTGANDASSPAAMGMVINLASPVGADQYHGSVYYLIGPASLNTNNVPNGNAAASASEQPDFSIGGPIKREHAWFFFSGRYIHRDDGISQTAAQSAYLKELDPSFGRFANQSRGFVFLGNSSIQIGARHRLMGIAQYDSRSQDANYQWYTQDIAKNQYGGGAYGLRLISQWTPRLTTRFLISYNNKGVNHSLGAIGGVGSKPEEDVYLTATQSAGTLVGEGSSLATLNNLSSVSLNPAQKESITGDLSYYVPKAFGTHELDAGFYLQPHELSKVTTYYANGGGIIQEDAALNNPNDPTQGYTIFHTRSVNGTSSFLASYIGANDYAWYIQDRWHPFSRLSITAGLRPDWISGRDAEFKVTTQHSWNWAPRIGGAYVLTTNQRNVVRASWTRITDITNASYLGTAATSTVTTTDTYYNPDGTIFGTPITTPGSTTSFLGKSFDPHRHQGYVREWLVGYRTQLKGEVSVDVSYIDREYRDRPAEYDTNQIYTTTNGQAIWSGLVNPALNNTYYVTNNKWNWFVYQGIEISVSKQAHALQLFSTYTYSPDHIAGTWQPEDPTAIIEPTKFANNAGIGSVRGYVTNDWTGDTRNRMWQRNQSRTGVTWNAPYHLRLSTTFTAQSGTPGGPVITTLTALGKPYDGQYGPSTLNIDGRTVSNPLATAYRFQYKDRGTGQIFCPWLLQWNVLVGGTFHITDRQTVEVDLNIYNVTNNGAAQQFVNGNNAASGTFGELQNIQQPRSAQIGVRYHF